MVFLGYEDDKVQLPFTVTDLNGRNLQLVTGPHDGKVCSRASVSVNLYENNEKPLRIDVFCHRTRGVEELCVKAMCVFSPAECVCGAADSGL